MAFVPADDLTVGGDQGRAEDGCGGNDEAVGGVAVEIHQTTAFETDLGMERFEADRRLQIGVDPTIDIGLQVEAVFGGQHGHFPYGNGRDNSHTLEVLQRLELPIASRRAQPDVRVENGGFYFLKHRPAKLRPW